LWFAISLAALPDHAYTTVLAWAQRPLSSILLVLFVLAAGYHSSLGVQVVIEDYVHAKPMKVFALMASTLAHFALTIAGVFAILRIAFGLSA
jgi:succinate dehydrogenase / fumarate reductase membrane anchor subunit